MASAFEWFQRHFSEPLTSVPQLNQNPNFQSIQQLPTKLYINTPKKRKKMPKKPENTRTKKKLVKGKKRYTLGSKPSKILFSSLHDKFEILSPKAPKHKQCSGAKFSRYIWNESAFNGDH